MSRRCSHGPAISFHTTRDSRDAASAQVANGPLRVALFPPGSHAECDCAVSGGTIKPEDCSGVTIFDADGAKLARFEGKQFRVTVNDDGSLCVYKMPMRSSANTQDEHSNYFRSVGVQSASEINQLNSELWRRRS